MVQTRDLAEYTSGRQTALEIGRQADIGGVCRNVARADCGVLFEIHGYRHRRRTGEPVVSVECGQELPRPAPLRPVVPLIAQWSRGCTLRRQPRARIVPTAR